jgi:LAO/AO transport system kinase
VSAPTPEQIASGDRRALARAITLAESTRSDHRSEAEALLTALIGRAGGAIRVAISGAPGVGKSTLVEALGRHAIAAGHRVAVLAVDPSSQVSGGSILGDKTRMELLGRDPRAFVRPSPAGTTLGGVARHTRDAILLCEAAGFDVVIVETVGVGQSEAAVAAMVDLFVLVIAPGGGDELQGIKRGIVELAELIVVNKQDGDLAAAAGRIAADYRAALGLLRPVTPHWQPEVQLCSALENRGIADLWHVILRHRDALGRSGERERRRAAQARAAMWAEITETVLTMVREDASLSARANELEAKVTAGEITASQAARHVIDAFRR